MARIITDLEVDDERAVPFRKMRYPIDDGKKHNALKQERSNWFISTFENTDGSFTREEAENWTKAEFEAFFTTQDHLVNKRDPGDTISKLLLRNLNDDVIRKAKDETRRFYQKVHEGLIAETPMKTYIKRRYYTGADIKLLKNTEQPPPASIWACNATRLANIIAQLNLPGKLNEDDLEREIQAEKSFIFPAADFGAAAASVSTEHVRGNMDPLHRQMDNLRPRRLFIRGDQDSISSSENESNAAASGVSDLSEIQRKLAPKVERLDRGRPLTVRVRKTVPKTPSIAAPSTLPSDATDKYRKPDLSTILPEDYEAFNFDDDVINHGTQYRSKRAFLGRPFPCFGFITPMLIGTQVFPLAPKQEKLFFTVATDGPMDHYDGEPDHTYLDDIRRYMDPVLAALQPNRQSRPEFLNRAQNDFHADWLAKFPFASHRLFAYCGMRRQMTEAEMSAFQFTENLYSERVVSYIIIVLITKIFFLQLMSYIYTIMIYHF